jgi:hypothetical protein
VKLSTHLLLDPRLKMCESIFLFVLCASTTWKRKSLLLSLTLYFGIFHIQILFYSLLVFSVPLLSFSYFCVCFVHYNRLILLYFIFAVFCTTSSIEKLFRALFFITNRHAPFLRQCFLTISFYLCN